MPSAKPTRSDDVLPVRRLTPRQRQILLMAAQDMTRKEILYRLGLSAHTVDNYIFEAKARLGVHSLVAAVWAARRELEAPYG